MSVLARPDLTVEVAFRNSPFTALDDPALVWDDITSYVELDKGISIQRRRANELDEPSPGTLSLTLDNSLGHFTRLNPSSPFYPNVKHNRLIRVTALWNPTTSVNLLNRRQATGGQADPGTVGFNIPSGTTGALTATGTGQGTSTDGTYIILTNAEAANFQVGDIVRLTTSAGAIKEDSWFRVASMPSAFGFTNVTFDHSAAAVTVAGDVITRYRVFWDTGNQATTGARLSFGASNTDAAGPDAVRVTAALSYTWSAYVMRGATAISVSPRILWYDSAGALLSESTGSTTALTTSLQRLTLSATAPANAVFARPALANETVFNPVAAVAFRGSFTSKTYGASAALQVTIPSTVQSGDALLLWVNLDDETATATTPAGWTVKGNRQGVSSRSYLFRKVAASTDAGKTFTIAKSGVISKTVAICMAYYGTDTTEPIPQFASVAEVSYVTAHVTPNITTTTANDWIVSACFDRSSTTSDYTVPGGDTERSQVCSTGSNAPTGVVSDNAAPVAAGTYGTKTFTANRQSDDATMWTVAIKPGTTSGASSGSVYVTGAQFEQAGSASAWTIPAGAYRRFVGHVDAWPTAWEGGFRALTQITATDRMKLLNDAKVRDAITEQVLFTGPAIYNPLNEESGATGAANASAVNQPTIPIVSRGTVTDEMLEWSGGTGPGTDAQSALKLTPTSTTVGKALRGTLTTPFGGDGVTDISVAICFNSTVVTGQRNMVGIDDGKATDGGVVNLLDIYVSPATPQISAHLRIGGTVLEAFAQDGGQWHDGHTHMAQADAHFGDGGYFLALYVDGALKDVAVGSTNITEFPLMSRWTIGCSVADDIQSLYSGTLSHAIGWNNTLPDAGDLWDAARDGFTGDLPGARAQRIADWKGLTTVNFEAGAEVLGSHPSAEMTLLDAYKLIARSEGGVFLVSREGLSTLQGRAHRANAISGFSVAADRVGKDLKWAEDPTLIANEITVKYGGDEVHSSDAASQDDYGVQDPGDIDTILATGNQALDRADAYLARYSQPISRPDAIEIEALVQQDLFTSLLGAEVGDKFTVTGLPTGAPAANVDLFIEGIGEDIDQDGWKFALDCSPAGFDFGLILDDPVRGLLDSNYLGW